MRSDIHCERADDVADEWRRAGVEVIGPVDEEYGKREGPARTLTKITSWLTSSAQRDSVGARPSHNVG